MVVFGTEAALMMGILVSSAGAARLELELAPLPAAAAPKKILSYPQASRPIIPTFMVLTARSVSRDGSNLNRRLTQPNICAGICLVGSNLKEENLNQTNSTLS